MKPNKESECGVCRTPVFERNAYFYGKAFTVRDLLLEQRYLNEKRWLVNRMILGCGVVCGLDVSWDAGKCEFKVETGLALDCCGREILICEPQYVEFTAEYSRLCETGGQADDTAEPQQQEPADTDQQHYDEAGQQRPPERYRDRFVLCLEYQECETDEVYLPPLGCDEQERKEFNHVRESFKLRLRRWDEVKLPDPNGRVECLEWPKFDPNTCRTDLLHQALCRREKKECRECSCGGCIVLATILVLPPERGQRTRDIRIDTCTYRRLVYRNQLLYELIYCQHGDLPHIVDLSWYRAVHPHREIEWDMFVRLIDEGLAVTFDQEMEAATLNQHTFIVSFLDRQQASQREAVRTRIPGTIRYGRRDRCYEARFIADERWITYRLKSGDSPLSHGEDVEILIRGNNIMSKSGKALDAEFIRLPTGNGIQGGEFIDYFRVLEQGRSRSPERRYDDF